MLMNSKDLFLLLVTWEIAELRSAVKIERFAIVQNRFIKTSFSISRTLSFSAMNLIYVNTLTM